MFYSFQILATLTTVDFEQALRSKKVFVFVVSPLFEGLSLQEIVDTCAALLENRKAANNLEKVLDILCS